jgi:hypothetical protein
MHDELSVDDVFTHVDTIVAVFQIRKDQSFKKIPVLVCLLDRCPFILFKKAV